MSTSVLYVTSGGVTGSLSNFALTVAERMGKELAPAFLCDGTFYDSVETFREGVRRDRGDALRVPTLRTMFRVRREVARLRPKFDMVEFCSQRYFMASGDPQKDLLMVPDVFPHGLEVVSPAVERQERHGFYNRARNFLLDRNMRRSAHRRMRLQVLSEYTRRSLRSYFDYPDSLIRTIAYPLSTAMERRADDSRLTRETARAQLGLSQPSHVVLSLGATLPRKNPEALNYVINHAPEDTVFLRIGPFSPESIAPEHRDRVIHRNSVDLTELATYYQASDVLFFPSYAEGFGVPLIEAMAFGLPIVASNVTSVPEVAHDSALYAPPDSLSVLLDELRKVLLDPEMARTLSQRSRERGLLYRWSALYPAYRRLYEEWVTVGPKGWEAQGTGAA